LAKKIVEDYTARCLRGAPRARRIAYRRTFITVYREVCSALKSVTNISPDDSNAQKSLLKGLPYCPSAGLKATRVAADTTSNGTRSASSDMLQSTRWSTDEARVKAEIAGKKHRINL
jgi:hypothetical protein